METDRLTLDASLDRLLLELDQWQAELRVDVTRAQLRGLHWLAGDLRRLTARVDAVLVTGRRLRRPGAA